MKSAGPVTRKRLELARARTEDAVRVMRQACQELGSCGGFDHEPAHNDHAARALMHLRAAQEHLRVAGIAAEIRAAHVGVPHVH